MKPIVDIAKKVGISEDELELYGKYKAKISNDVWDRVKHNPNGKLILVTAMNPTPSGEGKTLTTIGLSQALNKLGKKTIAALREPSLGPVFGIKGGATGSGNAQIVPMEDVNLHFTGDMHAITSAHNLLSALIDNHIYHGNTLNINPSNVVWKRAMDMNDRALRDIVVGLGESKGSPRQDEFIITVASEIMAILCLSENLDDLKERISKIIVAYNKEGNPVTAKDLNAQGSMALLLKDAIKPNLVQTIENTPVFIHGGPFGNIAHGCSSIISTKLALKLSDYVITEAGFGADLGAEKFLDIKCRVGNLKPDVAVIVATIKALKYNAGVKKEDLHLEDNHAVSIGFENLEHHILNLRTYGIPVVVALNHFTGDFDSEVDQFLKNCASVGVPVEISKIWEQGGTGGEKLANLVIETINTENSDSFQYIYDENQPIKEKVDLIVKNIYGGIGTVYSTTAEKTIKEIEKLGLDKLPICIAKTQYSISDQPNLLGRPTGFKISVREIRLSAGAGFIVVIAGDIMTMPGLPKNPASNAIDVSSDGQPIGLR